MRTRAILTGNPNSGKTTLFNRLTGKKLKTGNRAGVTIDSAESLVKNNDILLVDTPGLYSLTPYTTEETNAISQLRRGGVVVNVVDALSIERGLYLTVSLIESGMKPILFLSMKDRAQKLGVSIDEKALSKSLNIPVTSDDAVLLRLIKSFPSSLMKTTHLLSPESVYEKVDEIASFSVKRSPVRTKTEKTDKIILNPFFSLPFFALVMSLTFFLVYKSGDLVELLFSSLGFPSLLENFVSSLGFSPVGDSLLRNGILRGVGSVLSFLPRLFSLFVLSAVYESSGYLARVAVSFDFIFSRLGLSGKAIIPFILGSGCSVPAVLSTKTIKSLDERRKISFLVPFVPCSAKLPIIALFAGFFFKTNAFSVTIFIYFLSIAIIIFLPLLFGKKDYEKTMLAELPIYAFPSFKQVLSDATKRSFQFIKKTGTVIFSVSVAVWFLSSFSFGLTFGCEKEQSILAFFGKIFSPLLYPVIGTHSWAATVSALLGFVAKEEVVSTMSVLAGTEAIFSSPAFSFFTFPTACAYLVFVIFSSPCVAAVSTIAKETGKKSTFRFIAFQNLFALVIASLTRLLLSIFFH